MKRIRSNPVSLLEQLEGRSLYSASTLDASFDADGKKGMDFLKHDNIAASYVQPDGKTLVAENVSGDGTFELIRFNKNGSLDKNFAQYGAANVGAGGTARVSGIATTPDGHILVAGDLTVGDHEYLFAERFNANGTKDFNFGYLIGKYSGKSGSGGSIFQTEIDLNYGNQQADMRAARGIAVSGDGSFYLAGTAEVKHGAGYTRDHYMAMIHVKADGKQDFGVGKNGVIVNDNSTNQAYEGEACYAIGRQADGKLLLAGRSDGYMGVERWNANGTPDSTFGDYGDGLASWKYPNENFSEADGIAIDNTGKIVVGGNTWIKNKGPQLAISRLDKNGHLDTTFNKTGMVVQDYVEGIVPVVRSVAVDHDNNVLAGLSGSLNGVKDNLVVARFTPDGKNDTRFGILGYAEADFGNTDDELSDVIVTPTGQVELVGVATNSSAKTDKIAMARFVGHAPRFSIYGVESGKEGAETAKFKITRDGNPYDGSYDVKLKFGGTAKEGKDYTFPFANDTVHFMPGQSTYVIELPITNDSKKEGYESLRIDLDSSIYYDIDVNSAFTQVGVYDND